VSAEAAAEAHRAYQAAMLSAVLDRLGVDRVILVGYSWGGLLALTFARDKDTKDILATVEWMKDGAEGDVIASRLLLFELDLDEEGGQITSCVVLPPEADGKTRSAVERRGQDRPRSSL
jgi:pimeloyl-ACP methyl ester carboxylesterase